MKLRIQHLLLLFFSLTGVFQIFSQENNKQTRVLPDVCLTETESLLFQKINEYREQQGLEAAAFSRSLTYVAQMHVKDLAYDHPVSRRCNLHSWSSHGPWEPCCYTDDHKRGSCMWNKPRELTNYSGEGYEIAYWTNEPLPEERFAEKALAGWKRSPEHNNVIINKSEWKKMKWNAMGVGCFGGYAVVWFGVLPDEEQDIHLCKE